MYYTCLKVTCENSFAEILMAEVAEAGFETFMETDQGFEAYVELERFDAAVVQEIKAKYSQLTGLTFRTEQIQKQNWNEQWEKNYHPIVVENKCLIRASFHEPNEAIPLDVVITPKMSFGTGHHQTTYLMVSNQMQMDHEGKRVMDAGCGTAILSIVASKSGAKEVEAFDIDEWSLVNGNENIASNGCRNIRIRQGKIDELPFTGTFDIILANINKNVLLAEMGSYHRFLSEGGYLLLSGFYSKDVDDLLNESSRYNLHEIRRDEKEGWASLLLKNN